MIKHFLILTLFLSFQLFTWAQEEEKEILALDLQKKEVREINSQTLYRVADMVDINEWRTTIYYDAEDKIRKTITEFQYPEGYGYYHRYFNREGVAIHSLYASFGEMNNRFSVTRYLHNNEALLYIDFLRRHDYETPQLIEHIKRYEKYQPWESSGNMPMPTEYSESGESYSYDKVTRVDSLATDYIALDLSHRPANKTFVSFVAPSVGDVTFINDNSVELYKEPSTTYSSIMKLHVGDELKILKDAGDWYKVAHSHWGNLIKEGYVLKQYLEPIEHKVEAAPNLTWEQKSGLAKSTKLTRYYMNPLITTIGGDYKHETLLGVKPKGHHHVDCGCMYSEDDESRCEYCPKVYFVDDKIRMVEDHCYDAGYYLMKTTYFDAEGKFTYMCILDGSQGEDGIEGYMYTLPDNRVYYNFETSDGDGFHTGNFSGCGNVLPTVLESYIGYYKDTQEIINKLKNYGDTSLQKIQVQFSDPEKGDLSFTNAMNINMRAEPNTQSKIITKQGAGLGFIILDVVEKKGNEKFNWYKVEAPIYEGTVGYIYGEFLEPVEKEIKK